MKLSKLFFATILLVCVPRVAVAQCSASGSGTNCNGALVVAPPLGNAVQSGVTLIDLGLPPVVPALGYFNISIVGGMLQESDDGRPYHSLVGPVGPTGPQGPQGLIGPEGPQGGPGLNGVDGKNGLGVPLGGRSDQILVKQSEADYDTAWVDRPGRMPFDYTFQYPSGSCMSMAFNVRSRFQAWPRCTPLVAAGTSELGNARDWIEMSGVSQIRLLVTLDSSVLPDGSYAQAEYRGPIDGQWYVLSRQAPLVSGADVSSSGWTPIPPDARGDYVVRIVVFNSGTAAAYVGLQQAHLQFK
jgi:hypothetical protein